MYWATRIPLGVYYAIFDVLRKNIDSEVLGDFSYAVLVSSKAILCQKRFKKVKNRFFEVHEPNTIEHYWTTRTPYGVYFPDFGVFT